MRMNNFTPYDPEGKPFGEGVQYFKDDKGRDFYESRDLFTKKYVIFFDSHGILRAAAKSEEVTRVNPTGLSVIDFNAIPKDFDFRQGIWKFDGKKITRQDFDPAFTTARRKRAAADKISAEIVPLQDAVDLEGATEEEREKYNRLRKMRIALMRIPDDTQPQDVDWSQFSA